MSFSITKLSGAVILRAFLHLKNELFVGIFFCHFLHFVLGKILGPNKCDFHAGVN